MQVLDLRIGFVDDLVQCIAQMAVLVGKILAQMFLVEAGRVSYMKRKDPKSSHLLRCLIRPEGEGSACTFHDCRGIEAAEDARLVVFTWRESGLHHIIIVGKKS